MEVYKIGYVNNDCTRIKYKKVLITLLLLATVKTNIDRSNIIDKKYAKYRCNKAYVKDIIDNNNKSYNLINSDCIPNLQSLITDMYKELPSLPILDENKKDEILSDIQNMNDTKINDIISSVKDNMKNQMSDLFKLVPEIDNKFNEMMNNFMNKDTVLKMTETLFSNDNKMNNLSNIFASDLFKDILNKIKSDQ